MQKSFLSWSLFPSEYQLPRSLEGGRACGRGKEEEKEIVPDPCRGSEPLPGDQAFLRLRHNARQEERKEINPDR